ncbi:STAS domain-containing protein [Nocardia sp. CWNU-33]|uniref:STAS domain-containing protein n=1 Tax=Nocardia sp. CWNU-33 TaxID=3392117 RepID=UPI00398F4279
MGNEVRELVLRTRSDESAVVLSAAGEVDMVSAPKLSAAVAEALSIGSPVLVIDLSEVGFFGSAGVTVLVEALEASAGRHLRVVATAPVRRPVELTGFDELLDIYGTLEEALAVDK